MDFILDTELQSHLNSKQDFFEQIMTMHGEVFRELENRRTQRICLGKKKYFLKQHFGIGWKEIVKNLFQLRLPIFGAKNEFKAIKHLEKIQVNTMRVMGYGQRGCNPAAIQSFLLTAELTKIISLEDLAKLWQLAPPKRSTKLAFIKAVAYIARLIHASGMNHRDFYICHFLWDQASSENDPRLFLIDLHRAQLRAKTPLRWLIKDLAGLYFSSKDMALTTRDLFRFIIEYRQAPLRDVLTKESDFWQKVKQRGDKLYRQHGQ